MTGGSMQAFYKMDLISDAFLYLAVDLILVLKAFEISKTFSCFF